MTPPDQSSIRRPWLAIALLAALASVCISLGFWQLERAGESRATAERFAAARELPAIPAPAAADALETLQYRKVEVVGRYVPQRQILLDNIVRNGVAGYYVLTPFEPEGAHSWLLVNRGWVRADADRRVLPEVRIDAEERRVEGFVAALPSPGLRLGEQLIERSDAPVRVLSYPTMAELEISLGQPLQEYQLLLHPDEPNGFERDFPAPALEPGRHLSYAVQWWLFGAIAGGAACVIGWRELRRRYR